MKFPCPPGCVDHYTVDDTRNHETMPRSVTGADVYTSMPLVVSVWMEQRDTAEAWELVGVLEKTDGHDVEFNSYQLRELAHHMTEVADHMDAILAARKETKLAAVTAADLAAMQAAADGHVTGHLAVTVTVTEKNTRHDTCHDSAARSTSRTRTRRRGSSTARAPRRTVRRRTSRDT